MVIAYTAVAASQYGRKPPLQYRPYSIGRKRCCSARLSGPKAESVTALCRHCPDGSEDQPQHGQSARDTRSRWNLCAACIAPSAGCLGRTDGRRYPLRICLTACPQRRWSPYKIYYTMFVTVLQDFWLNWSRNSAKLYKIAQIIE